MCITWVSWCMLYRNNRKGNRVWYLCIWLKKVGVMLLLSIKFEKEKVHLPEERRKDNKGWMSPISSLASGGQHVSWVVPSRILGGRKESRGEWRGERCVSQSHRISSLEQTLMHSCCSLWCCPSYLLIWRNSLHPCPNSISTPFMPGETLRHYVKPFFCLCKHFNSNWDEQVCIWSYLVFLVFSMTCSICPSQKF